MKKFLAALLAFMMIFAFAACGDTDQEQTGLDGVDATENGAVDPASNSDLEEEKEDEPRYTSDGELIVEEPLPASDSDLTE